MPDAFSIYDEEPDPATDGTGSNAPTITEPEEERTKEEWARERRKRADLFMYGLPPFETPTYDELRRLYRERRHDPDVRRLILEIQCARYAFSELAALAGRRIGTSPSPAPTWKMRATRSRAFAPD
ncbi:hypothetical protein [Paraburkholderia oxyphila]|uniref:hypothetical protein n=1 Tax=Paraburkholderia oxyphila TaxID=614212 RepID=UPI00048603F5|nr:hypothetical protein [Paraburkholderia oxyphila]